jgi:Fur family ferric uptake transcriptional regulator
LKVTTRSTRQRRAIRSVFERLNRPLGPQDVLQEVAQEVEGVGIATVYRTINTLHEEGVLVKVDLPGESSRYEIAGKDHHHHFRCQKCDQVFELSGCLNVKSLVPPGFRMTSHDIVIFGQCSACLQG